MTDNFDFYKTVVYQTLPRAHFIWTPVVMGAKRNVVFAREYDGATYVFKFNGQKSAIRNSNVSRALRNADIPAPEIIAQNCDNQWFEMYPVVDGQTLYECVGNGIGCNELKSIYSQLLKLFEKMSYIDAENIAFGDLKYAYQTAYNDTAITNGVMIGRVVATAVRLMNTGNDCGLYHHGITPKNIVVSNRGKISGLLDIDEVGICNKNYAMGVLLAKAKLIGVDIRALCDEYERTTGQKLNRGHISAIIAIQNLGRNILYRTKSK